MNENNPEPTGEGARLPQSNPVTMPWFMCTPWVPKFSAEEGGARFGEWHVQMEAILRAQGLAERQQLDFIMSALDGRAKREAMLLTEAQRSSPATLWAALKDRFGALTPAAEARSRFFDCTQRDESVQEYLLRSRELFSRWRRAEPEGSAKDEATIKDQFIRNLREGEIKRELKTLLRRRPNATFQEVSDEAEALDRESRSKDCRVCHAAIPPLAAAAPTMADLEKWKETMRAELQQEVKEQMATLTETLVREIRQSTSQSEAPPPSRYKPKGEVMHGQYRPNSNRPQFQWDRQGRPICLECGQSGHIQRYCPTSREAQAPLN